MEKRVSGPWPAAYKEAVTVGLKLAPPKASPMMLKMKTRTKTMEVVIKTEGQTRVSKPRAVAISAVIAPMVDETNTHMNVSIASPIAAFIAPISFTSNSLSLSLICGLAVAKEIDWLWRQAPQTNKQRHRNSFSSLSESD